MCAGRLRPAGPFRHAPERVFEAEEGVMNVAKKRLPWFAGACVLVALVAGAIPPPPGDGVDLSAFRSLPVVAGGRVKPVDTATRTPLRTITGKESVTDDTQKDDKGEAVERKVSAL